MKNLIKNGNKLLNDFFVLYYLKNNFGQTRFFIANIGKKLIPKSCDRNLVKRRIRAILNKNKNLIKNHDILVIAGRKISSDLKFSMLENYLLELLYKIGEK
ncbi:MAG: ribonuclease P protein component [Candidatus Goldbacteria bacterium]|nr:ribonuclease P protein component [Candidatus Goldiibacteriota bacterium]